ncbi:TfoX/Sxy family protein [Sungkyunkwania multivorans]|uniref:TfoX/Sxy family protein n=1 Tax=Sungkyunkwania multivorans TaxID=1173618 RepID=A0ABW3CY49_9FLAO
MACNETLANGIREIIRSFSEEFTEKKMFGGLSFLYKGKMTVGIIKEELVVRIVSEKEQAMLDFPYVRPMDFTKRPMKEFIYVSEEGLKTEEQLVQWITLGLEHAKSKLK